MKIKITADSTCDLRPELLAQYDIGIIPLSIVKDGKPYKDGIEITPRDIFEYVESGEGMTQTTAVNPEEYLEAFRGYLETYDAIVHLNIGSLFSICNQNANIAAAELEHVYVIDSENLSIGTGLLAIEAGKLVAAGKAPAEIKSEIEAMRERVEVSFVIDTLKYLHKGGRCSAVQALGANLLSLKPCIEVKVGKMDVGKKYRGTLSKTHPIYLKDRFKDRADIDTGVLYIACTGGITPERIATIKADVANYIQFDEVIEIDPGCAISCHCGPKTMGTIFLRK
ncbi:MAG: DegV family protein [Oscillospiraceae bacterium]|nr:DegV family protein [Oscillospiraceae bacterium]